jgi:hypothetical protein
MNNFIVPERGFDTVGLVVYLAGPGRFNEHENQRVIAAAETLGVADGTRLDTATGAEIRALGEQLDSHRRALGVHMRDGHVWHCAISLPRGEFLSDEQWAEAARLAIARLGFDESSGKAPCRWVAVHHGQSVGGNEHIHLVVNLVREDGTCAATGWDRVKMSRVCAELEQRFGLRVVEGRAGAGMPGLSRAEIEGTARVGKPEPDRARLARIVRGCATAASSEADFVHRLRQQNALVRPRYARGGRDEVVGYSVALRPRSASDPAPIWFGGGRLGRDLTLPRLREHWPASPDARQEALAAWSARRPSRASTVTYRAEMWEQAAAVVDRVRRELAGVPAGDTAAWAGTAREAAGVLAAWSVRLEVYGPGPLAAAADTLARSAQTHLGQPRARRIGRTRDLRGVAMLTAAPPSGGGEVAGQLMLMRQLVRLVESIAATHEARGQAQQAAALADLARTGLAQIQFNKAWMSGAVPTVPHAASPAARPPGSPPTPGPAIER